MNEDSQQTPRRHRERKLSAIDCSNNKQVGWAVALYNKSRHLPSVRLTRVTYLMTDCVDRGNLLAWRAGLVGSGACCSCGT